MCCSSKFCSGRAVETQAKVSSVQGTLNASDDQYRVDNEELHNVRTHLEPVLCCAAMTFALQQL